MVAEPMPPPFGSALGHSQFGSALDRGQLDTPFGYVTEFGSHIAEDMRLLEHEQETTIKFAPLSGLDGRVASEQVEATDYGTRRRGRRAAG